MGDDCGGDRLGGRFPGMVPGEWTWPEPGLRRLPRDSEFMVAAKSGVRPNGHRGGRRFRMPTRQRRTAGGAGPTTPWPQRFTLQRFRTAHRRGEPLAEIPDQIGEQPSGRSAPALTSSSSSSGVRRLTTVTGSPSVSQANSRDASQREVSTGSPSSVRRRSPMGDLLVPFQAVGQTGPDLLFGGRLGRAVLIPRRFGADHQPGGDDLAIAHLGHQVPAFTPARFARNCSAPALRLTPRVRPGKAVSMETARRPCRTPQGRRRYQAFCQDGDGAGAAQGACEGSFAIS